VLRNDLIQAPKYQRASLTLILFWCTKFALFFTNPIRGSNVSDVKNIKIEFHFTMGLHHRSSRHYLVNIKGVHGFIAAPKLSATLFLPWWWTNSHGFSAPQCASKALSLLTLLNSAVSTVIIAISKIYG
jgi:hypothetical protein